MNPENLFRIANTTALISWLILALAGRVRMVSGLLTGVVVPALLACAYCALLFTHWRGSGGSFQTLAGVASLFASPYLLLAGWIHYLAFDLFIGSWQMRDAVARGIPQLVLIPFLLLTFLFGPAGLLAYFLLRWCWKRTVIIS